MTDMDCSTEIQLRLRRFWGATFFALGILWGFSSLVYVPVVVLTSLRGGSAAEVALILLGGLLIFVASIRAFYRRRAASVLLVVGGCVLLAVALALPYAPAEKISGADNWLLTFSSSVVAVLLGCFGWITDARGWPVLRDRAMR
jgi:hypothetical protein